MPKKTKRAAAQPDDQAPCPTEETLAELAEQLPSLDGEPANAYRAFLLWASQEPAARQWLTVARWLGKGRGYTTQFKRWAVTWDWEGRAPLPDPVAQAAAAAQAAEDVAAKAQRRVQRQTQRALSTATQAADQALTAAAKVERLGDEVTERLERLKGYEGRLRSLWSAQLQIGTALLSKLVPAVQALDASGLKPRDLASLLTATRGMVDSAAANLSEAEGVTAFLDQARRELEETPSSPLDEQHDQETAA